MCFLLLFSVCCINKGENDCWPPMSLSMNLFNILVLYLILERYSIYMLIRVFYTNAKVIQEKDYIYIYLILFYTSMYVHYNSNGKFAKRNLQLIIFGGLVL